MVGAAILMAGALAATPRPACLSAADAGVLAKLRQEAQAIADDALTRAKRDEAGVRALQAAHISTDAVLSDPADDRQVATEWGAWARAVASALRAAPRCR